MSENIQKIKNKFIKFYNSDAPTKIECAIAISVALIMLILYAYNDLKSLTIWSTNMLDVIFDFDITNYYAYTAENIYNAPHQYVSGTLYNLIPWAIWNIPIWFFQRFLNVPILNTALSLIWSKLFLVFCLLLTLYFTYKIVIYLTNEKSTAKWAVFLSATFFYTYVGVFYAGQTCIQICLFGTIAIYMLLKKNEKLFLLFSSLAISTKYFFFFPYVALILLIEKDLFKIIKKVFIGILPIVLFGLLTRNFPMYDVSSSANPIHYMFEGLINSFIPIMNSNKLSLFILGMIFIYFLSYIIVPKNNEEKNRFIVYFTVSPLMLIFMFTNYEFYRMILLMPFVYILYSLNKKYFKINIILDTILSISSAICISFHNVGYFFSIPNSMKGTLLVQIFGISDFKDAAIGYLIGSGEFLEIFLSILSTLLIAVMMIILVINFPRFRANNTYENDKMDRWLIWIRMLLVVPYILFTIIMLF